MQPPRPQGTDEPFRSSLPSNIVKVAILIVLVVLLYLDVVRLAGSPTPGASLRLTVARDQGNWSVTFASLPSAKPPAGYFLLVRNASGGIAAPRTALANLTPGNWAMSHILYSKTSTVDPDVAPGDRLLIDRSAYPEGHAVEISDDRSVLAVATLQ